MSQTGGMCRSPECGGREATAQFPGGAAHRCAGIASRGLDHRGAERGRSISPWRPPTKRSATRSCWVPGQRSRRICGRDCTGAPWWRSEASSIPGLAFWSRPCGRFAARRGDEGVDLPEEDGRSIDEVGAQMPIARFSGRSTMSVHLHGCRSRMYFWTVCLLTLIPSLRSSPRIRSAPPNSRPRRAILADASRGSWSARRGGIRCGDFEGWHRAGRS